MLDTSALALHSNKPSQRQKLITTKIKKSNKIHNITFLLWSRSQVSHGYSREAEVLCILWIRIHISIHWIWRTEIPESLYGPQSWQHPCFDRYLLSVYSFSMCCALVWELEEDGRLFSRCHFLSQCTWVISKPFKKNISCNRYRTLQKENVKEAMISSW